MSVVEALIVAGEAPESDEEILTFEDPSLKSNQECHTEEKKVGLGVGAITSLSSVTASVGKQFGAISGLDINGAVSSAVNSKAEESKIQHPTILHKKLYERNASLQQNIVQYFENLFTSNLDELSKVTTDCFTINTYLQESVSSLQQAVINCNQLDESMKSLSDSFRNTKLP